MITIIYSTHKEGSYNTKFNKHLQESVGLKGVQIIEYKNNNEFSLAELYNKGISESKYDIVVTLHNDVHLEKDWGKKLLKDFQNNPEYGIIGKAGTSYFPKSGVYWEEMKTTMVGQVYHHPEGSKRYLSRFSTKLPNLIPVISIDGLFISFDKTKIKHTFDESIGKFHYYDHPFCLSNYTAGVKIGVTSSFEITHDSVGQPNKEFYDTKELFLKKFGSLLPLDLKPSEIYVPKINEKPFKNTGKVAVIILTKGKIDLLKQVIDSFIEYCNENLFEIFVADTGSTEEEKTELKDYIYTVNMSRRQGILIHLIEYDYYNFAKINNDVVTNHIDDSFEYLLFCNNDIKILNNVIYNMLKTYKLNPKTGTVGARLHFGDNTIQHDGITVIVDKNRGLHLNHIGIRSYYNYTPYTKEVIGNTGALLMIKKNIFNKCGKFNENYVSCFEDVELNMKCIVLGYKNFNDGESVAYHYESQTRNDDPNNLQKLNEDYTKNLVPFFTQHYESLRHLVTHLE